MPNVGEAWYELGVRDQKLLSALGGAESKIAGSGKAVEKAFGGQVAGALDTTNRRAGLLVGTFDRIGGGFLSLGNRFKSSPIGGAFDKIGVASDNVARHFDTTAKAGSRFGGVMDNLHGSTSRFGGVMRTVGQGVLQGIGIGAFMGAASAATAMVGAIGKSISAASDLNETQSKVAVVFGKSRDEILKWGKGSAEGFGLSENAAEGAAATFGNLFLALKLPTDQIPKMSTKLVELAGDLASFNNTDPADALEALRSGLVGEVEPLRRYGVNLSEAALAQEAMRLGLVKTTTGVLPAAVRTQAAYSLILQQTTTAQGDFARTSTGLANEQRISAAKVENAMARVGAALLPIAAHIVPLIADGVSGLADAFGVAIAAVQDFVTSNQGLFDVIGTIAGLLVNVLGAALGAMAQGFGVAFGIVQNVVGAAFDVVKFVVGGIIGTIRNVIGIAADIPGPWQDSAKQMRDTLNGMQKDVESWGQATVQHAGKTADDIVPAVTKPLIAGAPAVADAMDTGVSNPIAAAMTTTKADAKKKAEELPGDIASAIAKNRDAVASGADTLKQAFKDHISPTKEIARLEGDLTGKMMKKGLSSNDPIIRGAALQWARDIHNRLFELQHGVGQTALDTGANYADALQSRERAVVTAAITLVRAGGAELKTLRDDAHTYGSNAGKTFADGIASREDYLTHRTAQYLQGAAAQMRAFSPPKEGPLREIDVWGRNLGRTFADEFAGQGGYFKRSVSAFLSAPDFTRLGQTFEPIIRARLIPGAVAGATEQRAVVEHVIRDPDRALSRIGTTPNAVADALVRGLDATGFTYNLRHVASVRGA